MHLERGAEALREREDSRATRVLGLAAAVSVAFHATMGGGLFYWQRLDAPRASPALESVVDLLGPPPPPPPPAPRARADAPERPSPPAVQAAPRLPARPPPPARNEAAPLLTAPPLARDAVQESVATGRDVRASGDVDSLSTQRGAPSLGSRPEGAPDGTGQGPPRSAPPPSPPPAAPAVELSASPGIDCGDALDGAYPREALQAGLTEPVSVRVQLSIDASGRVTAARALGDPGYGFAEAAVGVLRDGCRISPARDAHGEPIAVRWSTLVRFEVR